MTFAASCLQPARWWIRILSVGLLAACAGEKAPAPAMSERANQDAIGASKLPGAAGVRAAQRIGDSAAARRARLDSIARQP